MRTERSCGHLWKRHVWPQTVRKKGNIPVGYFTIELILLILHKWILGKMSWGKNSGSGNI